MPGHIRLGRIGLWNSGWSNAQRGENQIAPSKLGELAAEVEALGYGTIWIGGGPAVSYAQPLLQGSTRITVATGILSIWEHEATDVAARRAELERRYPGRFLLGLGVSHGNIAGQRYARPYEAMQDYLTALDSAPDPVPADARILAALGPKMLALSRDRAAGAHPYLVTVEHTVRARQILGDGAVLAPELKVVLDPNRETAAATARDYLRGYLRMINYTNSLSRVGFQPDDFADGGSDRLLDAVFALGDADAIAEKVNTFLAAGADHVAVQVVTDDPRNALPIGSWRRLAETLPMA
jgi:probable F420-dependent oxidoreductase